VGVSPSFVLGFFGFFFRGISPRGPLQWLSSPPQVAALLITAQVAESPGSGRMGVIGALIFFYSEAV